MAVAQKNNRLMLSVTTTPEINGKLNRLVADTGMSKKRIVNLGIVAFEKLSAAQRAKLNGQLSGGVA